MTERAGRPLFAHVLNPLEAPSSSDLHRAQPITFRTLETAKEFAQADGLSIEQLAVFFPEDQSAVPQGLRACKPLDRSCLDYAEFTAPRRLPLLRDIIGRALLASNARYLVYTNADIAVQPHFYLSLAALLQRDGSDAVTVCRRTISDAYQSVDEIPLMLAELGEDHPGTDCFVFSRRLAEQFVLEKIVIGAQFFAFALRSNLHVLANKVTEYKRLHLTFHLGDRRDWEEQDEYSRYNLAEIEKMFAVLNTHSGVRDLAALADFRAQFESRRSRWRSERAAGDGA